MFNIDNNMDIRNYLNQTLALVRQIKEAKSELEFLKVTKYSTRSNYYSERVQKSNGKFMVFERNLMKEESILQKIEYDEEEFYKRADIINKWCLKLTTREAKYIQDRYLYDVPLEEIDYYSERTARRIIKKAIENIHEQLND
ncbi:MAG: hypothetical protein GXY87_01155 [Tissierellia bacterium]|nr:hypothetical protein [Tissierellia bacterium]